MSMKKSPEQRMEHYRLISEFENENSLDTQVKEGLHAIFLISQNLPAKEISDFFSGENFSITESFEELENSYALIKYGFYKQAMISLRIGFEIGLFSIYWSILGKNSDEYKKWLSSNLDTPYKNDKFWKVLKSNQNIDQFDRKFNLIQEIKSFGLSDFVHTKGLKFSNFGEVHRQLSGRDQFEDFREWVKNFKQIVRILEILHLLKFPTLSLKYSTDFLISKFGTINKIPQFGGGFGDEMDFLSTFVSEDQLNYVNGLCKKQEEVEYVVNWLSSLPDLTDKETKLLIIDDQKNNIRMSGFTNWVKNANLYDWRIDEEIIGILQIWAIQNNLMTKEYNLKKQD